MVSWKKLLSDPIFPYFFPFFLFGAFLFAEAIHPLAVFVVYPIKTFCVGLSLVWLWPRLPQITLKQPIFSVLIGVIAVILWIGLEPVLCLHADHLRGFNPYRFAESNWGMELMWGLVIVRIFGAAVVVPPMEELFWRGFLMRFLINMDDFEKVALGTYQTVSFFVTTAFFAVEHGEEWPLGVVVGLLYGWWFVRTKSLGSVMLAHAVTNLLLGIYVFVSHRWYFW